MPRVIAQLPPIDMPIADSKGIATDSFRALLQGLWLRSGGFDDFLFALLQSANTGDATLAEVSASAEQNALIIENLRALVAGNMVESLQQELQDLRNDVARLSAQLQGIQGEETLYQVQVVTGEVGALATVARTGQYADLIGEPALATVATTGQYADLIGEPVLAIVATSGAYADLTGKPTLGTVADEDTGTTGHTVPLLDGANDWSAMQTFGTEIAQGTYTAGVAVQGGTVTMRDSTGVLRTLLTT